MPSESINESFKRLFGGKPIIDVDETLEETMKRFFISTDQSKAKNKMR